MEKKNTILLTVIAIATLLVAVVGATFAYFTATVQPSDDAETRTTSIRTATLPTATMKMGASIGGEDLKNIYPGAKFVRSIDITGSECPEGEICSDVETNITLDAIIADEFNSDVKWSLYESNGTEIKACTNEPNVANGIYSTNGVCEGLDAYASDTPVISGTASTTETQRVPVTVSAGFKGTYYLVVEYTNHNDTIPEGQDDTNNQNAQQGKTFTVKMDFVPAP